MIEASPPWAIWPECRRIFCDCHSANGASSWLTRARGEDVSPVTPREEVKSISREHTFEEDVSDPRLLESTLIALTEDVCRRLRGKQLEARTVTVKIRYADFVTHTCSHTCPVL